MPSRRAVPRRYAYGRHRGQDGELWSPDGRPPAAGWPVVVLVHGGFWRARYRKELMTALAADVVGRGWAAWNIEYRRLGMPKRGGWPTTFEDVAAAVDHLGTLVRDHPLDLTRVVSVGHSAGGHLALWAAGRPGLPESAPGSPEPGFVAVTAVVGLAPVADLEEAAQHGVGRGTVEGLLGGSPSEQPERYRLASPAARLPLGVVQVVVHGDRDEAVPFELSRRYVARACAAGDEAILVELNGVGHMELIDPTSTAWAATLPYLRRLLA